MQKFVGDVNTTRRPSLPPLFERVLDEDTAGPEENCADWLACGARLHREPPPVRYPVLNMAPQSLCRPDPSPPARYPVLNVPAIAVSASEAAPPARYPTFRLAPSEALRADALALRRNRAQRAFTDVRDPGAAKAPGSDVWMGRGLSAAFHASLVAIVALLGAVPDAGDSKFTNQTAGIEVALETITSAVEPQPPTPITDPVPEDQQEEIKPEDVKSEEPKPLDEPVLTTTNAQTQAVAPKIVEKKPEEPKKSPPKPKSRPRPPSGGAPATQGNVNAYSAMVRARISAHRPGGAGLKGTATVSFAISGGGGLAYARISHSSGSSAADSAALQAVRSSAPFPPPPGGQRINMAIPFYFR